MDYYPFKLSMALLGSDTDCVCGVSNRDVAKFPVSLLPFTFSFIILNMNI